MRRADVLGTQLARVQERTAATLNPNPNPNPNPSPNQERTAEKQRALKAVSAQLAGDGDVASWPVARAPHHPL